MTAPNRQMLYTQVDPQVLGYLGRALSLELSAVQQYTTVAALLRLRGFAEVAEKFAAEQQEEMAHVERIVARMLVLGASPNASQLRPVALGDSLPVMIKAVEGLEQEIVSFYQQAVQYCREIGDHDNLLFFEQLLREEQNHAHAVSSWWARSHSGGTPDD